MCKKCKFRSQLRSEWVTKSGWGQGHGKASPPAPAASGKLAWMGPGSPDPFTNWLLSKSHLIFVKTRQEIHLSHCVWKRVKKTSPRNQDKPQSCLILSHLQGNFFLYLTSDMFGSYLRTSITGGSVCLQFGNFVTSCLLRYDSYLLILMIIWLLYPYNKKYVRLTVTQPLQLEGN